MCASVRHALIELKCMKFIREGELSTALDTVRLHDERRMQQSRQGEESAKGKSNFFDDDRLSSPVFDKSEPCMSNCKPSVKVTMRARVLDVTPEDDSD